MPTAYDFNGRVALVTGAASGIGRAIATALLAAGARVHVADINVPGMDRVAQAGAATHTLDIANRDACHATVQRIVDAEGRLDILVNAAGGSLGKARGPMEGITESDWHAIFDANAHGVFWLCQAVVPHMKKVHYGRIVNIASSAGLRPAGNGNHAYCASKHALVGMTRQMAVELGPFGITVNAVAPGLVMSGSPWALERWQSYTPDEQERLLGTIHMRRLGESKDIAYPTLFLASEESAWTTGQILSADGGRA